MTSLTERDIIKGCQRGIPEYQKALVMRYSPMLLTVGRRYSRDYDSAKDILQESFIKIFRALPNYRETGSFQAWMRRIVINTALQLIDKSSYKNELPGLEMVDDPLLEPDAYSHLGAEELMKLIDGLPDGFREVFNLFVIDGFNHKEIAEQLEISESTSRSRLTRARKLLRKQFRFNEIIRV